MLPADGYAGSSIAKARETQHARRATGKTGCRGQGPQAVCKGHSDSWGEEEHMNIGERIRRHREAAGMLQEDLAREL